MYHSHFHSSSKYVLSLYINKLFFYYFIYMSIIYITALPGKSDDESLDSINDWECLEKFSYF